MDILGDHISSSARNAAITFRKEIQMLLHGLVGRCEEA